MNALLVGYARCSTDAQDLTAQRDGLVALGVTAEWVYVDHGLTGTNRDRSGLRPGVAGRTSFVSRSGPGRGGRCVARSSSSDPACRSSGCTTGAPAASWRQV
jgi:hypothetical protein